MYLGLSNTGSWTAKWIMLRSSSMLGFVFGLFTLIGSIQGIKLLIPSLVRKFSPKTSVGCGIEQLSESMVKSLFCFFNLLVTVGLEDLPLDQLPEVVRNLLNLKCLSLRKTKIKTSPKFIGKLQKIQNCRFLAMQALVDPPA
ncbi:hypothetical protein PIB30_042530 [Stylosanthes scabra]|uniref:Uncharacterized protein n=1 Tax=Stylosanthes scabra TaxID=79078 RepID=A0ABU6UEI8_9FABA|nr:hypothetical protein [Stylosanthes scabra]